MGEERPTKETAEKRQTGRRRRIAAGAVAAVCLAAAGAGLFHSFVRPPSASQEPAAAADTGLIDWQKVMEAHPDYSRLKELREECRVLELEVQDVSDLFSVQPPEQDPKPFEDSVWAKNALDIVGQRAEIERKSQRIAEEYRKATEADYEARRRAVDEEYLNAILNLNLKLDNQEAMHNPLDSRQQKDEERAAWLQEREKLRQERGMRQWQLYQEYQQEIEAHVQKVLGPELAAWRAALPQKRAQQQAEAAARQTEADKRNAEAMQKQMELAQKIQQRLEKRSELADKQSKLQALEAHIFNDIAGKAAKIAILHHFTLILADHPRVLASFEPSFELVDPLRRTDGIAVGVKTMDVTDELVSEVRTLEAESDSGGVNPDSK